MTIEQLRKYLLAQPFQPFIVQMADGKEYSVPHREFMSHSPSGRTFVVFVDDEVHEVLDLLLMTGIRVQTRKGKRSNGNPKKSEH